MSKPAVHNLDFYQGDDERFNVFWEIPPGNPAFDLTGAVAQMDIRLGPADNNAAVVSASVGDGITIVDGPGAELQVFFSAAKTVLLIGDDDYEYDLQVTPVGGDKKTIMRGRLKAQLERTRE